MGKAGHGGGSGITSVEDGWLVQAWFGLLQYKKKHSVKNGMFERFQRLCTQWDIQ